MFKNSTTKIFFGFATIYLIWGSTYLAIRLGVETMPPFLMAGTRFLAGGLLLYGLMRLRGVDRPNLSHWRPAVITGLLMPAGGTGLVTWAETTVPSGMTALLVAMVPMWIVLADWSSPRGTRPTLLVSAGLILGFAGVALMINPTDIGGPGDINKLGALAIVVATISWAIGSIYSRHADQPRSKVLSAGMQMIAGGAGLLLASALYGEYSSFELQAVTLVSWLSLGYLTIIGSIAFVAYVWLLTATTAAKVSTYAFVNPIIALALGTLVAGEALSGWTLGCAVIVIAAVTLIIAGKARTHEPSVRKSSVLRRQPVERQPVGCQPAEHLKTCAALHCE